MIPPAYNQPCEGRSSGMSGPCTRQSGPVAAGIAAAILVWLLEHRPVKSGHHFDRTSSRQSCAGCTAPSRRCLHRAGEQHRSSCMHSIFTEDGARSHRRPAATDRTNMLRLSRSHAELGPETSTSDVHAPATLTSSGRSDMRFRHARNGRPSSPATRPALRTLAYPPASQGQNGRAGAREERRPLCRCKARMGNGCGWQTLCDTTHHLRGHAWPRPTPRAFTSLTSETRKTVGSPKGGTSVSSVSHCLLSLRLLSATQRQEMK